METSWAMLVCLPRFMGGHHPHSWGITHPCRSMASDLWKLGDAEYWLLNLYWNMAPPRTRLIWLLGCSSALFWMLMTHSHLVGKHSIFLCLFAYHQPLSIIIYDIIISDGWLWPIYRCCCRWYISDQPTMAEAMATTAPPRSPGRLGIHQVQVLALALQNLSRAPWWFTKAGFTLMDLSPWRSLTMTSDHEPPMLVVYWCWFMMFLLMIVGDAEKGGSLCECHDSSESSHDEWLPSSGWISTRYSRCYCCTYWCLWWHPHMINQLLNHYLYKSWLINHN